MGFGSEFQTIEEIIAALESLSQRADGGNNDENHWTHTALKALRRACPLALKITLRQLQAGADLSLADCLRMELRIANTFMQPAQEGGEGTFYEGVRAQLVDRDRKPSWKPASLQEVTNKMVEKYFISLDKQPGNVK